jgi:hypothetical protein
LDLPTITYCTIAQLYSYDIITLIAIAWCTIAQLQFVITSHAKYTLPLSFFLFLRVYRFKFQKRKICFLAFENLKNISLFFLYFVFLKNMPIFFFYFSIFKLKRKRPFFSLLLVLFLKSYFFFM